MKIKTLIAALAVAAALTACSSRSEAERAVTALGFTDVKTTGYRLFGCSEDDNFHTGFEATDKNGKRVTGVVCSGFLKGATVRID